MSWDLKQFKTDLSLFNSVLTSKEVPVDTSSLFALEGRSSGLQNYEFNITDIEFHIDEAISGTIPIEINAFKIRVNLDFIVDSSKDKTKEDPFLNENGYLFEIEIIGNVKSNTGEIINEYYNSWRLDRHIEGGAMTKVDHPFYHFQNGGNNSENLTTGQIVLTAAPRLPHPPLDIFLAVHFVISNFYNRKSHRFVNELFDDVEYQLIIERAQQRMWKPYFNAFNGGSHSDYTIEKIYPLYTVHHE